MKLRFQVPLTLFIAGPSPDAVNLRTGFVHDHLAVTLNFTPERSPVSDDSLDEDIRSFVSVSRLDLYIEEVGKGPLKIGELAHDASRHPKLVKLLSAIANRALRSIRSFGLVPEVHEIHPKYEDAEVYLRQWTVEISEDGENWRPACEKPLDFHGLAALMVAGRGERHGMLRAAIWPDIEEAIQDDLKPGPEQEFLTNALEHLNRRNNRLALVESIICLEIVLNDFLKHYLSINKGISNNRIRDFLTPDVGLKARVSVLLNLTLDAHDLGVIKFDQILEAIAWRNDIIHEPGYLPDTVTDETIRQRISSVIMLVYLLAFKRDQIRTEPAMRELGEAIAKEHGLPIPRIYKVRQRHVVMDMIFLPFIKWPTEEVLKAVAADLSARLSAEDARFDANRHLSIRYMVFPRKTWARWSNGQLEVLYKTREDLFKAT